VSEQDLRLAGEVVTDAKLQYVDVPRLGTVALITLDNGFDHTKPNTFGPAGLQRIAGALDKIDRRDDVKAIAVTGKPFIFAVGADLTGVPTIATREEARQIGALGHQVFRRLHDSAVPTFAFVNGAAMGGGLEIALHCHYRTISSGVPALALPECFLGLVPAWGGATLLPKLVGPDNAVKVIIENALNQNRMLKGPQAFKLGIADAIFEPADFIEQSLRWAASVVSGDMTVDRPVYDDEAAFDAAVSRGRAFADARLHGATPAPYRALELIAAARTASLNDGFAAEDEALADLVMGDDLRAGLYAFDLVQKRGKRPVGVPDKSLARPVSKVGIVGAGLMASQLGLLFAQRLEVPVVLTDIDQARVDKGVGWVHSQVDEQVAKGRYTADQANKLKGLVSGSLTKDAFADADFVIEAVFEDLGVKQQVFAEVEAVVPDTCVLATNTSSLSVADMAAKLSHPERVVGFHFFNPVGIMPLLEVARTSETDDATYATAFAVGKMLKKTCVPVRDAPAFVVNRLLTRFFGEVTRAIDEGTPFEVADASLEPLGLPMTPLILIAFTGPAVTLHVAETLYTAFPDRFYVSDNLRRLVEAGKTGVYTWDTGQPVVDPEVEALFERPAQPVVLTGEQVRDRALDALADEVRHLLDDGVVGEPQDVDLCMITGAAFPFHLGGVTPFLDRTGVSERVTGGRFLPPGVAAVR
jgi:3-hydroxyacyl-CoA dehydrogenase/enoyl-CoA hydratase/carnithine racemase